MKAPVTVAVDAMSGDHGPKVAVSAVLSCLEADPALRIILTGQQERLEALLRRASPGLRQRLELLQADEIVEMHERPARALRGKKRSSMRLAIQLVREGRASAAVSAGNTGALMAMAHVVLRPLPGIQRSAFVSSLPSVAGEPYMLDLGANSRATPRQLMQFAVMGSALATALKGLEAPRVSLLNVGEEEIKGGEHLREAARLIRERGLNYAGYIEADGIFLKSIDVVVCDGFTGNVALKAGEGVAQLIRRFMREEFGRTPLTRLAGLIAAPVLSALSNRVDPRRYNGASLLGLQGTVVKSHGGSDAVGFSRAIRLAAEEARMQLPERIRVLLAEA